MSAAVVMAATTASSPALPLHHNRPSRANVAAKTFQCTECSAVLLSPTEFQLHIEKRPMNDDSNNDEDSDVDAVTEDDFGKVSESNAYPGPNRGRHSDLRHLFLGNRLTDWF